MSAAPTPAPSPALSAAAPDLLAACQLAERFIDAIMDLYGCGLQVSGWHQNGALEPFDNFITENQRGDVDELEALRAAIAKATAA